MKNVNKVTHADFGKLIIKMQPEKEAIEKRFAKGDTITSLAIRYKVPQSTFRAACETLNIALPVRGEGPPRIKANVALDDLLIVVARIAEGLNVPHEEIKPYLTK